MRRTFAFGILLPVFFGLVASTGAARADNASVGAPGTDTGPPAGIVPVTTKLQSVLDAYDTARGDVAHKSMTDVEEGTVTAYGLSGTYRDVYAGLHHTDDFRSTYTLGPFTTERGRLHDQRWRRDENGITNVLENTTRADETDAIGFAAESENPKNDVTLLGEVSSPVDAYVVQVKRKDIDPMWSFYDKKTGLLDRVEIGVKGDRETWTFDDYRVEDGFREPWHTQRTDGEPINEYDSRITSDTYGAHLSDADLAIPPSRSDLLQFPQGQAEVDLPSEVKVDSLMPLGLALTFADPYVRLTINGRGTDMELDSTENGIVLDDEVAKELGLTRYGPYVKDDKGSWYPTRAVIPALSIGAIQMRNVVVELRHLTEFSGSRKIVGLIGYPLLANAVIEIDYTHGVIKAYDPVQFMPPEDSVATPVNIDDGSPFVSAQVGTSFGDFFQLDTTSPFTMIGASFALAHPDDVKDQGRGRYMDFGEFHDSTFKTTQLRSLVFGGANFEEWPAYEDTDPNDIEGVEYDGVIGCDFLQYFNVFFDYGQHLVYLEENDAAHRARH